MVAEISDRIRDGLNTAKNQIEDVQDMVVHSITDVREQVNDVPKELRGAWDRVLSRLWAAFDVPSREDFESLVKRVDALDRKLGRRAKKAPATRKRN
jgi:BMFP domain-containing protein YqiC